MCPYYFLQDMLFLRLNHNSLESMATSLLFNLYFMLFIIVGLFAVFLQFFELELDTSPCFVGVQNINFLFLRFNFLLNLPILFVSRQQKLPLKLTQTVPFR